MTTIVKAATAAQFLSFVPSMLGYHPARSLVLIPFDGARTLGAMRFDLPDASDERELDAIASTLIGTACRVADADAVAAIVYTDERFGEVGGMPHAGIAAALARRADACGLRMSDALCVGADGWGSHFDPECPPNGRPLNEIECDDDLPRAVGDQTTGADLPDVAAAEAERVARSLASLSAAVDLLCGADDAASAAAGRGAVSRDGDAGADLADPADAAAAASDSSREPRIDPLALAAACTLDDLPTLFEAVLEWDAEAIAPLDAAALIWCLSRPALRDIALVQWCGALADGDEALAAQLRWEAGEEYPAHLAMHMWGEGSRPDPERLLRALAVVRRVAAAAPPPSRPGPLATCAWLAWAVGRSTHAERYARLACDIEPEHGLAEIVRSFVHVGHLPDWAFQRQGAR